MTEREALIALNQIQDIGAITVKRIAEALKSVAAVFGCSAHELQRIPGVGKERAALLTRELNPGAVQEELARAAGKGITLVTWADDGYPPLLKAIADPPLVLYVAGEVSALDTPSVAIVGTRHPTIYGRETAQRFGYQLAAAGYTIVSGLAEGIDTEAHTGALKANGRTVAVLGGALDCLFPKSNAGLARKIVSGGGAVISEYPFGRQPDRQTFPMRNRVVSGLSEGVLA
ncbi:MAG: DNA-processing protein DprA, partial [Kiritimatiellaeota bacterium]|nr:DNA-processing protein DprA [Kiritimatiellota bacterium]